MSTTKDKPKRGRTAALRGTPIPVPAGTESLGRPEGAASQRAAAQPTGESSETTLERTLQVLSVDHETAQRIRKLPHDVGWLLVTAGVVGIVMPGVLGLPFLLLGGLILLPGTNRQAERWLTGHSPKIFKGSIRQINRFLDDLERRYPQDRKK